MYFHALKLKFPNAIFLESKNPLVVFNLLYNSVNVGIAVSTFSWLACFLSEKVERIFYPLSGILNPLSFRAGVDYQHNFINKLDTRIEYYLISDNLFSGTFIEFADLINSQSIYSPCIPGEIDKLLLDSESRLPTLRKSPELIF